MPMGLVVDSITIDGLRGFNNAQTIELDGTHTIMSGPMGTGKSSTLYAIEWAIFGDIAHIKCSESRTQAEFVNANKIDQKARVTLKLRGDDGEYIIQREKHAKKREFDLTFSTPTEEFEGNEAANQIYSIFGTFEDFHRSVFLHQEAIRAILTENPEERDSALDRLFGLERTRELMSAIPLTIVRCEYKKLSDEKVKIEERIKGATRQAEVEMDRARDEAYELGLKREDFDILVCKKRFKEIRKNILTVAKNCGFEKPTILEPSTLEEVSAGLKKVKESIGHCRMQIEATSKLGKLQKKRKNIEEAKEELEDALIELKEATRESKGIKREWGTIKQIEKKEEKYRINEKNLKKEREIVDSTSRLVADGIEVLSKQKPKNCPICDAKISSKDVCSKLEIKVSKALKKRLSEIDGNRRKIRERLLKLKESKKALTKAIKEVKSAKEIKYGAKNALKEVLQSKSKKSKILLEEARKKLSKLRKYMTKLEMTLRKKNKILQGIEDSAETCKAILRVLDKEAEYGKIRETFTEEDSQIKTLKTQIMEMSALHTRLQRISDAIATVQINLAREFINKGEKKTSDYYCKLCGHPYYNSVRIDIDQRNVRGVQKNTYNIKAFNNREGRETLISTRFSTGQMNCAALSIFLSLSSMLDRKIKFLLLDDPSQSLDIKHKKALVKVLGDVALGSQVIIATQDTELEKEIVDGFTPKGGYTTLLYGGWSKEGPKIKISKEDKIMR